MKQSNFAFVFQKPSIKGAKYGSIAGVIATWSISTAIAASELELGLPISTFYAIIGISLGSNDLIASAYLGFGLHLVTGTLLGAIIGAIAAKVEVRKNITDIFRPIRSLLFGIGTDVLVWLILFVLISAMLIQPSTSRIAEILGSGQQNAGLPVFEANSLGQSMMGIVLSAIVFHVIWGAIFGFIISSLFRIKAHSSTSSASSSPFSKQNHRLVRSSISILYFAVVAGLISSLAITALILLVEKMNSIPVGAFYYALVSALTNSYSRNTETVVIIGLVMNLAA